MTEHPILFSGPAVRAILNTEPGSWPPKPINPDQPCKGVTRRLSKRWLKVKRGDHLWVRETVCVQRDVMGEEPPFSDGRPIKFAESEYADYTWLQPHYRATDPAPELTCERENCGKDEPHCHWTPSIHMPRRCSRITLEATEDAREERLQDITESEIYREGITLDGLREWLHPLLDKRPSVPMHWIKGSDEGQSWCRKCAKREIRKLQKLHPGKEFFLDGGWATEEDSQPFCEGCHRELDCCYTDYAIESELEHFDEYGVSGSSDEHSLYTILTTPPQEQDHSRILKIGFRWLWSQLHAKPGERWEDNSAVVRIPFKAVSRG